MHLLLDGISSQRPHDRAVAIQRISQSGVPGKDGQQTLGKVVGPMRARTHMILGGRVVCSDAYRAQPVCLWQLVAGRDTDFSVATDLMDEEDVCHMAATGPSSFVRILQSIIRLALILSALPTHWPSH